MILQSPSLTTLITGLRIILQFFNHNRNNEDSNGTKKCENNRGYLKKKETSVLSARRIISSATMPRHPEIIVLSNLISLSTSPNLLSTLSIRNLVVLCMLITVNDYIYCIFNHLNLDGKISEKQCTLYGFFRIRPLVSSTKPFFFA